MNKNLTKVKSITISSSKIYDLLSILDNVSNEETKVDVQKWIIDLVLEKNKCKECE